MSMLVCISGKLNAGKDAAAEALIADGFERMGLADPMKRFLGDVLGLDDDDPRLWGSSTLREQRISSVDRTARHMLQTLGTEWGRDSVHPDLWANYLCRRYAARRWELAEKGGARVVVTDVRFPNEVQAFRRIGGVIIRIRRPSALVGPVAHRSETALDAIRDSDFDAVIVNDGTLDDLHREVRRVVMERTR